ncbi:2-keto-4-pentenoate hydratase/2-oxohepta-3-ene-1,7-dioic acid hydratase in catechol pathway [Bacillus fengqiuensis]|nr:2-keto-4-pentenoate hydratase/2-oxohepta-3-ene-1,7-dioic acid hydratase in catechol pathway [Bacillus fengqiuensis]
MKFVTVSYKERVLIGMLIDNRIVDICKAEEKLFHTSSIPCSMIELVEHYDEISEKLAAIHMWGQEAPKGEAVYSVEEIKWLAPIPRPRKNIFCVGKNYADHAIEMGSAADIPAHLMLFSKAPTSVTGHEEDVLAHQQVTTELDYEGELAVIIGKTCKNIKEEEAMDHVFGYTLINDVTARDLQERHKQFLLGKSLDTSCPMGPAIVHQSAIENPGSLQIETRVNGEVRQKENTEQFIFGVANIIATIAKGTTLEPGDIIATGTPAGVGKGFNPPRFLKPGDIMEVTIEEIGTLRNTVK